MDSQAVALRVLAHFAPSFKVLEHVAPDADWLDLRWCTDNETFYRELPEADVIWHVLRPLSEADLDRATRARLVQKFGAGVATIDVDAATKRGIAVANMPGANAPSVAEGTCCSCWPSDAQLGEIVRDIGGCTVGLVGYGNIAKRVTNIVAAMGATVLPTSTRADGLPGWPPLPELLAVSDIVSVHLPLTADTDRLIDRAAFAAMKPAAVLVNTSRGPIIDEAALLDALRDGRLAAAGLDVFGVEPVPPDNPLLGLDNVVRTPHVTGTPPTPCSAIWARPSATVTGCATGWHWPR